jgi:glucose-1-phosphate cytidylyltransferase
LKAVILAGGLGTRISEETNNKPKPMVKIGSYTLLEHIMHTYSRADINEFIIATGYLNKIIENYFRNYKDFKVTTFFTGEHTQTGGRIKRVMQEFNEETLCVTYGDGLGNIDIRGSLEFHQKHGKLATVTAVRPTARFGRLTIKKNSVVKFGEKMQSEEGWINGGFFILNNKVFEYISGDEMPFESNPLKILTEENQLMAYKHLGFWSPVDTLREKNELEELWQNNNAPWVIY